MDHKKAGWFKMIVKLLVLFLFVLGVSLKGQIPISSVQSEAKIGDGADILEGNSSSILIPAKRSSEEETIARAREDLKNNEVGRRVGAAKLLGKYRSKTTSMLLISALDDTSALVRRAVMVSLAEHASNGFYIYDKILVEKIYSKLGDSDVEVRREVSTMIPRMITGMMRSGMVRSSLSSKTSVSFSIVC